jgi:hypothetical protein
MCVYLFILLIYLLQQTAPHSFLCIVKQNNIAHLTGASCEYKEMTFILILKNLEPYYMQNIN